MLADFAFNFFGLARLLPPPGERDHAEGAKLVAPLDDVDESAGTGISHRRGGELGDGITFLLIELGPEDRAAEGLNLVDRLGQVFHVVGAQDEIQLGKALQQAFPFLLGQAAGESEHQPRIVFLERPHFAEQGKYFLFGFLPHGTGVDENQVGFFPVLGPLVPGMKQEKFHAVGIGHIHLAAEGIDINLFHGSKL